MAQAGAGDDGWWITCSPSRFSIIRHAIQPMTNPPANSGVADHGISIDIFVGTENKLEY
mgnify:CR=1 FL=1